MLAVAIVCFLSLPPTTGPARVLQHIGGLCTVRPSFIRGRLHGELFHAGLWEPCCVNVALVNLQDSLVSRLKKKVNNPEHGYNCGTTCPSLDNNP